MVMSYHLLGYNRINEIKPIIMKPKTYTQIYIHFVFSPKGRECSLEESIQQQVFGFIGQTINNKNHKTYIVNGMEDHIHILLGLNPNMSISDLVRDIKRSSSLYINSKKLTRKKFAWQDGYGAFSYGKSQTHKIYNYIENQKNHHKRISFKNEYIAFLERFGIQFDDNYLFEFYD